MSRRNVTILDGNSPDPQVENHCNYWISPQKHDKQSANSIRHLICGTEEPVVHKINNIRAVYTIDFPERSLMSKKQKIATPPISFPH